MECNKKDKSIPIELWSFIKKIPALKYMLEPVSSVVELYTKYTDNIVPFSYCYVEEENSFYIWSKCNDHICSFKWSLIQQDQISKLFNIQYGKIENGQMLSFDEKLNKFTNKNFNIVGLIEWTEEELKTETND